MKIPLCKAYLDDREEKAVIDVLRSGWLAHGPKGKELEEKFKSLLHVKHALLFNSCASALQVAWEAAKFSDKTGRDQVILPSFTFSASPNAILRAGLKPVFADIDPQTMNIRPESISVLVNEKTFGIMPVHYAGQPCDMKAITNIADNYDLVIVEDSAETIGATFNGKQAGTFGHGCFSFYPTKNMTTGEGGLITTNDDGIVEYAMAVKGHGISKSAYDREGMPERRKWNRSAIVPGFNFRMSDILGAIGIVQLEKLNEMNCLRQTHARRLTAGLQDLPLLTPYIDRRATHVFQMYVIQLNEKVNRDRFVDELNKKSIGASVHFDPPCHLQPAYRDSMHGDLNVTEELCQRIVTLPMYPGMTEEEIDYIVGTITNILSKQDS